MGKKINNYYITVSFIQVTSTTSIIRWTLNNKIFHIPYKQLQFSPYIYKEIEKHIRSQVNDTEHNITNMTKQILAMIYSYYGV